jgi:hypothetical protein
MVVGESMRMRDNRGYEINISDIVYAKCKFNLGYVVYTDELYRYLGDSGSGWDSARFKLKIFDVESKFKYVLDMASVYCQDIYDDCLEQYEAWDYIGYSGLLCVAEEEAIRNHQIPELFSRSLKAGDLVLYVLQSDLKYGLVISDTYVINEKGTTIKPSVVILLENLTEKEFLIYDKLKDLYLSRIKKKFSGK